MVARRSAVGVWAAFVALRRSRAASCGFAWLLLGLASAGGCAGPDVSEEDERAFGEYEAAQMDSLLPLVGDTAVTRFVNELGHALARTTSRAQLDWHFKVVDTDEVNAFAMPGGFVYMNRGLIETVAHYDELAGVLAHEVAHVAQRHTVEQLKKAARRDVGLLLLCTLTDACRTLGGVMAIELGTDAVTAQYSQHDEAEADSLGVLIAVRAGFDPEGIPAFFEALLARRTGQPTPIDAFFATHPTDEARIRAVRRQITRLGPPSSSLVRDSPEFDRIQERVRALPPPPRTASQ